MDLQFGLVQRNGGPCGVIASIQAYVLKHSLFNEELPETKGTWKNVSRVILKLIINNANTL